MEDMLRMLLRASLISAGWMDDAGQALKSAAGARRAPAYLTERWMPESVAFLTDTPCDGVDLAQLWRQWDAGKEQWLREGEHAAFVRLAETCLRTLPQILQGQVLPTEILFPGSSTEILGAIYQGNPLFDGFNSLLANTLVALIGERKRLAPTIPVRVLEVGAGTGATTALVLERLRAVGQTPDEYCFTDVSRLFLTDAERRFAAHADILRTRLFNIEKSPVEQNLPLAAYDVVVGSNVVHATANIRASLRNIKAVLKQNGVLLLGELGAKTLFGHVTFGLLEGWWLHQDAALRIPGTPLLTPEAWVRVLCSEGFREVLRRPAPLQDFGQQILVAESDGFVRLAHWTPDTPVSGAADARNPAAVGTGRASEVTSNTDPVKDLLRQFLADVLGVPQSALSDQGSFFEYGVDSLIAGRLINRINRSLGLALRANAPFEHRTITSLARHIAVMRERPRSDIGASAR